MKAVILAGGFGTRLSEETEIRPKPMVEIGGKPILWHIMKIYSHYGVNDFIICLGYKGYIIKEFFVNYYCHTSDITVNTQTGEIEVLRPGQDFWRVSLIETGLNTMTGGRLKRVREFVGDEDFHMTYGDGVGSINLDELLAFHRQNGRLATVTAVHPPGRFGALEIEQGQVKHFSEKPRGDGAFINAGFFVLSPRVMDYIDGDSTVWEREPMEALTRDGQLSAFHHEGFWQPMDTLRDRNQLENLWNSGKAQWKRW
ncbi:MAG: glucose-1-phosphate cytidylyltransferase [Proteobacteria bacterium]|nr:glucose-1-phosphate cytidylyltransferase [Pseudomonadota bacterium]MBU1450598.1 glucose-1-phosphate cytidylyltransferase [Pseudomonadota bacterium]MBU2469177.1 glucose-1-phosphate cytidylyltransferase [Pseudomonadota bacterium]MBU2516230.1 glucose-1-phosphate cytidylyltransferase [Pseudomonadota bacterium]